MGASLRDVAQAAGVSPRTVSNVVNNFVHVRESTRARVLAAIEELNYKPNISARRLRQGRTQILGFVVPELSQPYFAELSELVELAARERQYTVITTQTGGARDAELKVLSDLTSHIVDGLILSPMSLVESELESSPPSVPTVLVGEQISSAQFPSLAIDNIRATADITRHLIECGHTRIATLGAHHTDRYRSARLRAEGYRQALEEASIAFDSDLVLYTDEFGRRAGMNATAQALADGLRFDAIVCYTDLLASGAIRALADAGARVPDDVAIASIDDVAESAYSVPSLTTISPDKQAIATRAVDTLLELIEGEPVAFGPQEIGYRLIVRESSRSPLGITAS